MRAKKVFQTDHQYQVSPSQPKVKEFDDDKYTAIFVIASTTVLEGMADCFKTAYFDGVYLSGSRWMLCNNGIIVVC